MRREGYCLSRRQVSYASLMYSYILFNSIELIPPLCLSSLSVPGFNPLYDPVQALHDLNIRQILVLVLPFCFTVGTLPS